MTYMNLSIKQKWAHIENKLVVAKARGLKEGWIESRWWADANHYIKNGQTKSYYVALCVRASHSVCLTLCEPMVCSPSDSSAHGIFQARILEQVAISCPMASSQPDTSPAVVGFFTTMPAGEPTVEHRKTIQYPVINRNRKKIWKNTHISRVSLVAQKVKNLPSFWETWIGSLGWKIPWSREWLPTPVFLPGEYHGQRCLAGYSLWGHKQLQLSDFHFTYISRSLCYTSETNTTL